MKINLDNLNETYNSCMSSGKFKEKLIDSELIRSLKSVAEKGLKFIKSTSKSIPDGSTDWTFVFRDYYESSRGLIEAYLLFDGIEAESHQCKNAYVCFKYPEMELDWEFLETTRLKRNAINYRGQMLKHDDWKQFKMKFDLHISLLVKKIEEKLEE